jgi:tetratricopeptide (TPR) repeat protein
MIPKLLLEDILNGRAVLFLGAGASYGAKSLSGETIPLGNTLSNNIAQKFLDPTFENQNLALVAEVALAQAGLLRFQSFLKDIFISFEPATHHLLIPTFKWKSIFTTNYDKIIEKSYSRVSTSLQDIEPVYRNTFTDEIFKNERSLPYYKLHGCVDCINDDQVPLIITPDQYATHRGNRENLFRQLETLAYDHPIVFVGFSFADWDIREAIRIAQGKHSNRAQWYLVGPQIREAEKTMYEQKRISSIVCSFEDFLKELNSKIPSDLRKFNFKTSSQASHPFFNIFDESVKPTQGLINFIECDVDFMHSGLASENVKPTDFYKGYFFNWDPILKNLDAKRSIEDSISSQVYIDDLKNENVYPELYVILGHAGSGKSVLLKRLAFNCYNLFSKISFVLKEDVVLRYEPIYELYQILKTRFFIHVDNLAENSDALQNVIEKAKRDKIPVTIITTERHNIWNVEFDELKQYVTDTFQLKNLNRAEIVSILELLQRHNSLGHLSKKTLEERIADVEEKSDRQLLVALHEATSGRPFIDIIRDEFNSISGDDAKSLYLTVCILHRLGASTRAGLIARVHGIRFEDFDKRLFKPLHSIVFAKEIKKIRDMVYESRHRQIAELVFESILTSEQDRYDEYHRIITNLNIDFESDRTAYIAMTKAKNLLSLFSDPLKVRRLYAIADETYPNDPKLLQQQAIYELKRPNPSIKDATAFINEASRLDPTDTRIIHTRAELVLDRATSTDLKVIKDKYLNECEQICKKLIQKDKSSVHAYHTLLKAKIHRLDFYIDSDSPNSIEGQIKDIEKNLNICKQLFPNDSMVFDAESTFNKIIDDKPKALESLQHAYNLNKSSPYICIRLSKLMIAKGELDKAQEICQDTLKLSPNDKDVHFQLATVLLKQEPVDLVQVSYLLKRSFTIGDTRYGAQFWYGRTCFLQRDFENYKSIFKHLAKAKIAFEDRIAIKAPIKIGVNLQVFFGKITDLQYGYGFVKRDDIGDSIYFNMQNEKNLELSKYSYVKFNIAFNYKGANAINIEVLQSRD